MAGSINKVILVGNLGDKPEIKTMQSGDRVANFSIATSENWKDKASGERKERTEWHAVSIMNDPLAKIAEQYLRKGSTVYIEGQLETRKWQDQSGADRYTTEIVLRQYRGELTLLGGRDGGGAGGGMDDRGSGGGYDDYQGGGSQGGSQGGGYGGGRGGTGGSTGGGGGGRPDLDDEIPF